MSHLGIPMQDPPPGPRHRSGHRAGLGAILLVLAVVGGVAAGAWYVWDRYFNDSYEDYEGEGSGSVEVLVEPGETVTDIAYTLAGADVVASPQAFIEATRTDPRANTIAPGAYDMRLQMSGAAAFERILDPAARVELQVVLPEGLRIDQTVTRTSSSTGIANEELWAILKEPSQGLVLPTWAPNTGALRAEGFLFPATYTFRTDVAALPLLQTYVDRFNQTANATGIAESQAKTGYSPYEVLIIASLVQAEGHPEDYGKVARVIYNRLNPQTWGDTGGLLQLDATVNYGNNSSKLNLSDAELQQDGPYNTYTRQGLPPTPINSPGDAAIAAALAPESGDWLYYVTVNPDTGETRFTNDYNQFLTYKAEFQSWCKANPGKC